ncbi:MAG TPA: DsrE family protein [Casimicrobiaceae bacterium]
MKTLFILNDAPYGSERSYNGVRLAASLSKVALEEVKVFLIGDAASCAKGGQKVPEGFYNLQVMLGRVARNGAQIGVCGTCMDARGIAETELIEGSHKSTLAELTAWTQWSDKVIVF